MNGWIDFLFKKVKRWKPRSLQPGPMWTVFVGGGSCWLVASCSEHGCVASLCFLVTGVGHLKSHYAEHRWWELKEIIAWFTGQPFGDGGPYLVFAWVLWLTRIPLLSWLLLWSQFHGRVPLVWPFTQPCGSFMKRRRKESVGCLVFPLVTGSQVTSTE